MNPEEAKNMPMSAIMTALNFKPVQEGGAHSVYVSPLNEGITNSLVVNGNLWRDTEGGTSGDTIAFVCRYLQHQGENHTEADALRWIRNMTGTRRQVLDFPCEAEELQPPDNNLYINRVQQITNPGLLGYLESNGINISFANNHLEEISLRDRETKQSFAALGMRNEEGGYALFKPGYKNFIGRQAVSFIRGNVPKPPDVHVFYDALDYLTLLTIMQRPNLEGDSIIIHSMAGLKEAGSYIENYGYGKAVTYLPNTKIGIRATKALATFFKGEEGLQHRAMNKVYQSYRTLNAWHRYNLNLCRNKSRNLSS